MVDLAKSKSPQNQRVFAIRKREACCMLINLVDNKIRGVGKTSFEKQAREI